MSKSQCLANDWRTAGYTDGLGGVQSSALMRHQNACVKHGIIPDREAYLAGWEAGVAQYCQPANGFSAGERGSSYGNVCPAHLQSAFFEAYQDGRQLHIAETEIANLHRAVEQRERRLREVKAELAAITAGVLDDESTAADRVQLLLLAKDLAQEQGQIEEEMIEIRAEAAVKADRLESLRSSLTYSY